MQRLTPPRRKALAAALIIVSGLAAGGLGSAPASAAASASTQQPSAYAIDFVSTAAFGVAMNAAGDVTGTSYRDTGCGSTCLPPLDTVVWRDGKRLVLPTVPGFSEMSVRSINKKGWVAGFAGFPGTTTHAVVWKPNGGAYQALDLGTLPGTTSSEAIGIDDLGRVIGWSTTTSFPPNGSPFLWTEAGGMVDLSTQGFPDEKPLAISPRGAVATPGFWYQLGNPASVVAMPSVPQGFALGSYPAAINDTGDQARFLVSTGAENLVYLFRFHHQGTWQQLSSAGTGHLSSYGVGSITEAGDVSATVVSTAVIAYGPDGLAQSVAPLLSPAYEGSAVTSGGPMNEAGQILSSVIVGRSARLVRLTPAEPCGANCTRVASLQMTGKGPAFCDQGTDQAKATLAVTDEAGLALAGVRITAHFLDDYWTDEVVTGKTDASGHVTFKHSGPACVGAIALLVSDAAQTGRTFDRTTGTLTDYVIPLL